MDYLSWCLAFEYVIESSDDYFNSTDELLSSNEKHKYSILGFIQSHKSLFQYQGRYEFKLEYPELNGYNHWSQTVFPTEAQADEENGYEDIECQFTKNGWHGLSLSTDERSYIDGSPFDPNSWFYPIG